MDNSRQELHDGIDGGMHAEEIGEWRDEELGAGGTARAEILERHEDMEQKSWVNVSFLESRHSLLSAIRLVTLSLVLLSLVSVLLKLGVCMSLLVLLNNLEIMLMFYRAGPHTVLERASLLICRSVTLFLLKPVLNIGFCMVTQSSCSSAEPETLNSDLPLLLGVLTLGQAYLVHTYKNLAGGAI